MKYPKDRYDWLDEMLRKVLHVTDVGPDFETWKKEHPRVTEALASKAAATKRQITDQETQT